MTKHTELVTLIDRLFILTRFSIALINADGNTIYCRPAEDEAYLPTALAKFYLNDFASKKKTKHEPYMHVSAEGIYTGIIPIPGNDSFLFFGPSLSYPLDFSEIANKYDKYFTKEEFSRIYTVCINSSRTDSFTFANLLAEASENLYKKPADIMSILSRNLSDRAIKVSLNTDEKTSYKENSVVIGEFNNFENALHSAIVSGNQTALDAVWQRPASILLPDMYGAVNGDVYILLPFLTLFRRAALDGGADVLETFALYDSYAKKIANKKAYADYYILVTKASYRFCMLVSSAKKFGAYALPAKKCERYIQEHLGEKITIHRLAVLCGLSERQISRIFSECFHSGVSEYINSERIRQAKLMLQSDKYKIIDISNQLGYSSQSHFSKTFYNLTGYTPNEYRSKNFNK